MFTWIHSLIRNGKVCILWRSEHDIRVHSLWCRGFFLFFFFFEKVNFGSGLFKVSCLFFSLYLFLLDCWFIACAFFSPSFFPPSFLHSFLPFLLTSSFFLSSLGFETGPYYVAQTGQSTQFSCLSLWVLGLQVCTIILGLVLFCFIGKCL
jgi:hypothetical protein